MKVKYFLPALIAATTINTNVLMAQNSKINYPATKEKPVTDVYHGVKVVDHFRWLEDDRSTETMNWVVEQNKVTDDFLSKIPYRNLIKKRIAELWNYEKYGAPFKEGGRTYFYKNNGLQNQSVLYVLNANGQEEVFLDPNTFSADGTTSLSGLSFSKDGKVCAYSTSEAGADWNTIFFIDVETKNFIGDPIKDVKFSGISWKGNEGVYYSKYDQPKDGSKLSGLTNDHKLYYRKLGSSPKEDVLVFSGKDKPFRYVGGYVTEDQNFLVISAANATSGNELYIQNLKEKNAPIIPVVKGFDYEQDVVYSKDGYLYIRTNQQAPNGRLVKVDAKNPKPENWKTVIPMVEFPVEFSTAGDQLFAKYIRDAVSEVKQYNLDGQLIRNIELPGLGTASGFGGKKDETTIYYSYSSYIAPNTIYRYDIKTGESKVHFAPKLRIELKDYISKQVRYVSKDGTEIPMIITGKRSSFEKQHNATMLYGYGGFNVSLTPSFSVSNLVFMENGGLYAVANLRGGGEYGDSWHQQGTKLQKQNVFDDFIAAAEYLIDNNYTDREHLAISGGSNGGLLVGACMTQRPELFKVCFPAVGVLDMLRYHKFTSGAGWAYDYGTADDNKKMFEYLKGYSPVHNLKKGTCYPATMVTTGDHDDRVVPAHSFKFAAELQKAQGCDNPTLIRIETNAGHGAGKPTMKIIQEQADKWAFMFSQMPDQTYSIK